MERIRVLRVLCAIAASSLGARETAKRICIRTRRARGRVITAANATKGEAKSHDGEVLAGVVVPYGMDCITVECCVRCDIMQESG